MRRLSGTVTAVVTAAALLSAGAGGTVETASGDSCTATGSGNSFALSITIPAGAPAQGGFAVGVPQSAIMDMTIQSNSGTLSKTALPANTTLGETPSSPLPTGGTLTVNVETQLSVGIAGPFTIVPMSSPAGSYYDAILCKLPAVAAPSNHFSVKTGAAYRAATGTWTKAVAVPGPGTVSAAQIATKDGPFKRLVANASVHAGKAGTVKLVLRPTAAGKAALKSNGKLSVRLVVTFKPVDGRSGKQTVALTLRTM
jgi:hypothetical protein